MDQITKKSEEIAQSAVKPQTTKRHEANWLQFKDWCTKYKKLEPEQPEESTPYNIRDFLCSIAYVSSDDIKKRNESRKTRLGSSKDVQQPSFETVCVVLNNSQVKSYRAAISAWYIANGYEQRNPALSTVVSTFIAGLK